MESIVFDAISRRGSARVSTLTVPAADARAIGMSSLVLVGRAEEIPGEVRRMLETRYPADAATGYKVGDFRGIVSVVIPAE